MEGVSFCTIGLCKVRPVQRLAESWEILLMIGNKPGIRGAAPYSRNNLI
jgi:hypothetical protein